MKLLKINTESGIPKAIEGQDQRLECVIHVDPGDDQIDGDDRGLQRDGKTQQEQAAAEAQQPALAADDGVRRQEAEQHKRDHRADGDDHRVEEVADDPGLDDLLEAVNVGGLGRASGFWVK